MVFAVGAGGIFASQFHLLSHAVFKALLFLAAGAVIHAVGTRDMRQMGALRKQMPLVFTVFVIGALALMGIPVLNGFWSKELILEAGLAFGEEHGMVWAYALMLLCAGLTATYTARCVWMVFFGQGHGHLHGHDAGTAMRVALLPLALGAVTTWLLADPFLKLLETVPSFHKILAEIESGQALLWEVIIAPPTWLAVGIIALGLLAWQQRARLGGLKSRLSFVRDAAADSFGFEKINRSLVHSVQSGAESLRATQTGLLNWNIFAIVAGLVIVVVVLLAGG
jgi:NADH-quinone oxidoreductase subunit L